MNSNVYRLVKNHFGMWVPVPEHTRGNKKGKTPARSTLLPTLFTLTSFMTSYAYADGTLPTPCGGNCGAGVPFVANGSAAYNVNGNTGTLSQVGNSAIVNFKDFNVGKDNAVVLQQVNDLTNLKAVAGASFSTLARIYDANPSQIAGSISAAQGQSANFMMINPNGVVFANGAQINLNSFVASTLNISDDFFRNLFPPQNSSAQFQGAFDGANTNLDGYIRVMDGAKITSSKGGRVMLLAPKVINEGDVETPDGQAILAAGSKVFLATSDDPSLRGLLVEVDNANVAEGDYDHQGTVTNLGDITAKHGNITMVGYAVNQMGRATATSSLTANGSVYLMAATDRSENLNASAPSENPIFAPTRSGRVVLGNDSHTQVLIDESDAAKSKQKMTPSEVKVLGKDIQVKSGALIKATAGKINVIATTTPKNLKMFNKNSLNDPFLEANNTVADQSKVVVESGAILDVSGLDVETSIADNYLKIKLLGAELADSPLNRDGFLRGKEVWVDLTKGSPLISNIGEYQENIEYTAAMQSTTAGTVDIKSQGSAVVENNALVDLSGGKVTFTAANISESVIIGADGKSYKLSEAPADLLYTGSATERTKVIDRFNNTVTYSTVTDVNNPGYVEGKDAGTLILNSRQAYLNGQIDGKTTLGVNQIASGDIPLGATLQIGDIRGEQSSSVKEYGLNQNIVIGSAVAAYDNVSGLNETQKQTFTLNTDLIGKDKFNNLNLYTNQTIEVNHDINLSDNGQFKAIANNVKVNANIVAPKGVDIKARSNMFNNVTPVITVADKVMISAAGHWVNDLLSAQTSPHLINAGSIKLDAFEGSGAIGDIELGSDVLLDVRGGAYQDSNGKLTAGKAGDLMIKANHIKSQQPLQQHIKAESFGTAGTVDVTAGKVQVGGDNSLSDTLLLDVGFFKQGFANYNITGLAGLVVADNANIQVQTQSLRLLPGVSAKPTNTSIDSLAQVFTQYDWLRKSANISLTAKSSVNNVFSTLTLSKGSEISTDIGATVNLNATKAIEIAGKINAPAGKINVHLEKEDADTNIESRRIHLTETASLSTAGVAKTYKNNQSLTIGEVLDGGEVDILAETGYVDAESGAMIDVHGAKATHLDIINLNGKLGQDVASNAGTVNIQGETGVYLDNSFNAKAGSAYNKGGAVAVKTSDATTSNLSSMHIGKFESTSPLELQEAKDVNQAYVDAEKLEQSGFDRISLSSNKEIILEKGLSLGAGNLQSVNLNAPNLVVSDGNATIKASAVQLGNSDIGNNQVANATAGDNTLNINAGHIDVIGNTTVSGVSQINFNSTGEVRFSSARSLNGAYSYGQFNTAANIDITANVVSPTSLSIYDLNSTIGNIYFHQAELAKNINPYSVLGTLNVNARNITQDGRIVAPLGRVVLNASENLNLVAGSETSVAARADSVQQLGNTLNGESWFIDQDGDKIADASEIISTLTDKTVVLKGKNITKDKAAIVNVSGGGSMQAYEFSSGTGGTKDILAQEGYVAIIPGYAGNVAIADPKAKNANIPIGETIYLAGGNGLAAGNYTILPAEYALLPGAYAVKLSNGIKNVLPANSFTKQDGTFVIAGFLSDTRFTQNELNTAAWTGYEVLTRNQVMQRSEYKITQASDFYAKNSASSLPADAGAVQINVAQSLALKGVVNAAAAIGGRGGAVDITATKLAIVDDKTKSDVALDEVAIDVSDIKALNVESISLGANRIKQSNGETKLEVVAQTTRFDTKNEDSVVKANEVIIAAKEKVDLQNNSRIEAVGKSDKAVKYMVEGDAAVLLASASESSVYHTGASKQQGTISSADTVSITSSNTISLDATLRNNYQGSFNFAKDGKAVAGNLFLSADTINFGELPSGTAGLFIDQTSLDSFKGLNKISLQSYSGFNFYGNSQVGEYDEVKGYALNHLNLIGSGLNAIGESGNKVNLNAKTLELANLEGVAISNNTAKKSDLTIKTDRLVLGAGDKSISGISNVKVDALEVVAKGKGSLQLNTETAIKTARLSGESNASQTILSDNALVITQAEIAPILKTTDALGVTWKVEANSLDVSTKFEAHSGRVDLTATGGDLVLGEGANIDVSGQEIKFFDQTRASNAGEVNLASKTKDVVANTGVNINVSSISGSDAGDINASAIHGNVDIDRATLNGKSSVSTSYIKGRGAIVSVDAKTIANFDALNTQLNTGGFEEARNVRLRSGNLTISQAGDEAIKARNVTINVDAGAINVTGEINASGQFDRVGKGGQIGLYGANGVTLSNTANLHAEATKIGQKGGAVVVATGLGDLDLQSGSQINVADSTGADSGDVLLRSARTASTVNVVAINANIKGAMTTVLEAVKAYQNVDTLTSGTSTGATLGFDTISSDIASFMANKANIVSALGKAGDNSFILKPGVEVSSTGDLTVASDWNLYSMQRPGNVPGILTLRAANNLTFASSLSDGFETAGTTSAMGVGDSWSYRLIAGADANAANPMTVNGNGVGDFAINENKLIRTGTGNIEIAAAGDFDLGKSSGGDNKQTAVIYTAGNIAPILSNFVTGAPYNTRSEALNPDDSNFTHNGGDIAINVGGDIRGAQSNQLYSNWLFRQGQTNDLGQFDTSHPQTAWWVKPNLFQQGIGALAGGNVTVNAGGNIENLSVSSANNGRMNANVPSEAALVVLGEGDVNINAGGDIAGGQYYAAKGTLNINAQGDIKEKIELDGAPLYATIALADTKANISAKGSVNIGALINPTMVKQLEKIGRGGNAANFNLGSDDIKKSTFSTYSADSAVHLVSLNGNVNLNNLVGDTGLTYGLSGATGGSLGDAWLNPELDVLTIAPSTITSVAFNGDIKSSSNNLTLFPSSQGQLELLAKNNIYFNRKIALSDADLDFLPKSTGNTSSETTSLSPVYSGLWELYHSRTLLHKGDNNPVRLYAVNGDLSGDENNALYLFSAKSARLIAGQDIKNFGLRAQNVNEDDVSYIKAGRDLVYTYTDLNAGQNQNKITVAGPGLLDIEVGRNIDLGNALGIETIGNLNNAALVKHGADINIALGVLNGVDYEGALARLENTIQSAIDNKQTISASTLWQARWLSGDVTLGNINTPQVLLGAVRNIQTQDRATQRNRVRTMFYEALRTTGLDYNNANSEFSGNYTRGYDTIALVFPNIDEVNTDGSAKNYGGDLRMPLNSIKTNSGGDIEFMIPGGGALIGYAQVSQEQLPSNRSLTETGVVSLTEGTVRGFARNDMLVNQSRILTVGGGDILLWSSEGDLDAGKGKRTAVSIPPPIIRVDPNTGNISVELQGAATGSGIGALGDKGATANVDLIAPNGTVNAGDAGIRAKNVNIAAQFVVNAGNISASGSATGTQVADTGAISGALAGSSGVGSDLAKNVAEQVAQNAANSANNVLEKPEMPSIINVEVISIGK